MANLGPGLARSRFFSFLMIFVMIVFSLLFQYLLFYFARFSAGERFSICGWRLPFFIFLRDWMERNCFPLLLIPAKTIFDRNALIREEYNVGFVQALCMRRKRMATNEQLLIEYNLVIQGTGKNGPIPVLLTELQEIVFSQFEA